MKDRLIVALDVAGTTAAVEWARRLRGRVGLFKVGLELFVAAGPEAVRAVRAQDARVFLDLKLHDIPNTVAGAVRAATELGVEMLTVHAGGGAAMLEAAAKAAAGRMKLLGVTVLTSLDRAQMEQLAMPGEIEPRVLAWARLCRQSGLDGVVASAREAAALRGALGRDFLLVTPGIRAAGAAVGDQARVMSAGEAIRAGADYLVVGRPILAAPDPVAAAEALVEEMAGQSHERKR